MKGTRRLGIATTLAIVVTLGCGLAAAPRALAAPSGYEMTARHASVQHARYADWDRHGYWGRDRDGNRGWYRGGERDDRGFGHGRRDRRFGRHHRGDRDHRYGGYHRGYARGYYGDPRFRHYHP